MMIKRVATASIPYLREITGDFMLIACLIAPILAGSVFHFVLPYCEPIVCSALKTKAFFSPYYMLIDIFLSVLCTVMFSFSGVMTMLSELDNSTAKALIVTPLGSSGYFTSRIGIPTFLSIIYAVILVMFFKNSNMNIGMVIIMCLCSGVCSIIVSLVVVVLSKNKVEGMAITKMTGLLSLGAIIPYIVDKPIQYICVFLPYFWITKFCMSQNYLYLIPFFFTAIVWILALKKRFVSRFI